MQIKIKGTKIELTPEVQDYVQKKVDMLDKYLGDIKVLNCDVELELTTKHHNKGDIYRAEINLELPGEVLWVEKTDNELDKAIDKVKDLAAQSIKKYKEKRIDRNREVNEAQEAQEEEF